jgi:3-oxoacyl-[acyl-carrier-protein] synthase II
MSDPRTSSARVVITGLGAVTNLGVDARTTWEAMREGRSGISRIEGEEFAAYDGRWTVRIAGQIKSFDPSKYLNPREAKRLDRFAVLGIHAAAEAVESSGLDLGRENPDRCGVVIGSGVGGIKTIEDGVYVMQDKGPDRLSPFTVPRLMVNAVAGNVSIRYGLRGPSSAHATACASSGHSIGDAFNIIRRGRADVMIAGGAEAAVSPLCIGAFMTMGALSTRNDEPERASRPFDRDRDGFVLAEGAAVCVLELEEHARARGVPILAEVVGYGNSSDAAHITAPDAEGGGAARSMQWALEDSGLNPGQIDYVNAHGTSTPLGDDAEVRACLSVFGDHARSSVGGRLMMSSTKSMHGHTLGASGAVELLACVHAVKDGVVAPTINLENPGTRFCKTGDLAPFDVDLVPQTARERRIRYAMNNTFGFGGHNVTLVVARYEG